MPAKIPGRHFADDFSVILRLRAKVESRGTGASVPGAGNYFRNGHLRNGEYDQALTGITETGFATCNIKDSLG